MPVVRFIRVSGFNLLEYEEPHTFFACVVYRPMQDAHAGAAGERGHLHHRARSVSEDPAGRSFFFTTCGY